MKMSLQLWKNLDDYLDDPWRHDRSLLPYWRRHYQWRDDFGLDVYRRDLQTVPWKFREFEWKVRELENRLHSEFTEVITPTFGTNEFHVCMDITPFRPDEITVKTTHNSITIEGKHEERRFGRNYVSREFTRRYALPFGYNASKITSDLSTDGFLTIKAPHY